MSSLKLGVVVVSAHDLVPKDGHGAANPCVELHFDGQTFRTTVKEKDVNPVWNEIFYFNVTDSSALQDKPLEAVVYHVDRASHNKAFLGRVKLPGSSFFSHADAAGEALAYPLEKYGLKVFSRVRGELSLKLFITDDPSIRASTAPVDPVQSFFNVPREEQQRQQQQPPQYYSRATATVDSDPAFRGVRVTSETATYRMSPAFGQQTEDIVKETSPSLGGGRVVDGRVIPDGRNAGAFDLVEKMEYLFVRVVKARDLPAMDITGSLDPYVEVKLGNYKGETMYFEKNQNPEWNKVFAFSKDRLQATVVEVVVKDKDLGRDDFVGRVHFELNEVPKRVPPDSPLAPEWYRLEDKKGDKVKGELMLAVWNGTQADECFANATHYENLKSASFGSPNSQHRAKVYHAPRMWYLRVKVIAAEDVYSKDRSRYPEVQCRVQLGRQMHTTLATQSPTSYYVWNEEFIFVAAEPFEEQLLLSVEDRVRRNKEEVIGQVHLPLSQIEKRHDDRKVREKWHDLKKEVIIDVDQLKEDKFASKIQVCASLDGGYHVLHESTHYSSDLRPTAKQLWKAPIGLLELGILKADGLHHTKTGKGNCNAYCVAKYGQKWVRTRTVVDDPNPKFQEQYTWDVYDHGTVLTIGVFYNHNLDENGSGSSHGNRDAIVGKVRIRLSTLHTGRVYSHTYPLLVLLPSGVKKMGELHLAIRFSTTSMIESMYLYSKPLLPKMHYTNPVNPRYQEKCRHDAVQIVADRLSRMEPPLRREVVEYMSDAETHLWSMRRSNANLARLQNVFSGPMAIWKWFQGVRKWNNPMTTVLVHILFVMLVCFPELIFPTVFLYMFLIGVWHYRFRQLHPPHMDIKLSLADSSSPDDLDEEFGWFSTTQSSDIIRMRYGRLRHLAGKMQTTIGDIATQGERLQLLLTWRDPRATAMFMVFCLLAALVLYATPIQVVIFLGGFYLMWPHTFRQETPSWAMNFFRRLPTRADSLI